jgi:transcriptional regulator with XRE-family HTH domain
VTIGAPTTGKATTANRRRDDLAQFLRSRRERITPSDVGLPAGLRRRTPGLRREEVAQLAGVGVTWYTWLEQGRHINASPSVLDAIARTLRLDQAECEHLYRLADVPSVPELAGETLPPEIGAILESMTPLPAVVYNGRYDTLAWNRTYAALFPGLINATLDRRNVLWQMFTTPACCSPVGDRERELRHMVGTFRSAFGKHMSEPAWTTFVDRLVAASPEFAEMWARHDVVSPMSRVKTFVCNIADRDVRAVTTSFAISAAPGARMVVYTPVGDEDRNALEKMTRLPLEIRLCPYHAAKAAEVGT